MADNELGQGAIIAALVLDLMFASRVRGVAGSATVVGSAKALLDAVGPGTRLVLVDLQAPGALDALREVPAAAAGARVVAWAPHVMEDVIASAREAGAEVMARGAFVKALPDLVARATNT